MVSFERMSRIMDILGKKKVISTTQLESLVYCSTPTLRAGQVRRGGGR